VNSNDSKTDAAASLLSEARPNKGLFVVPKKSLPPKEKIKTFTSCGMVVIQSEFTDQLEALTNSYMEKFRPANTTEKMLVKDIATTQCRCEYVLRLQSRLGAAGNEKLLSTLLRYHTTNEKQCKRSLKTLLSVQKERHREEARRPQLVRKVKPQTVGEC
jgi:hypothetical protein